MLKLFVVFVLGSNIGGFAGPLPYGEAECIERAQDFNNTAITKGVEIRARCEWRDQAPIIREDDAGPVAR